jgi:hypothetical protein
VGSRGSPPRVSFRPLASATRAAQPNGPSRQPRPADWYALTSASRQSSSSSRTSPWTDHRELALRTVDDHETLLLFTQARAQIARSGARSIAGDVASSREATFPAGRSGLDSSRFLPHRTCVRLGSGRDRLADRRAGREPPPVDRDAHAGRAGAEPGRSPARGAWNSSKRRSWSFGDSAGRASPNTHWSAVMTSRLVKRRTHPHTSSVRNMRPSLPSASPSHPDQ